MLSTGLSCLCNAPLVAKFPVQLHPLTSMSSNLIPATDRINRRSVILQNSTEKGSVVAATGLNRSENKRKCLRCNQYYLPEENGPQACSYHGHMSGDRGLYALAPPHQGIDGEWTDASGVIVYKWNEKDQRPNTGRKNWKKRWSCCGEYDFMSPPCRHGWHLSYDDGATLF